MDILKSTLKIYLKPNEREITRSKSSQLKIRDYGCWISTINAAMSVCVVFVTATATPHCY